MSPRIGFFTRLLEDAPAAERYHFALEQIEHAERLGFSTAWIAQHHFDAAEGGLPSPFLLLAAAAERTSRIRLGTGVVTLAHENAVRTAEDAAVLDLLSGGRVELGVGTGASPESLELFGFGGRDRNDLFAEKLARLREALAGRPLDESGRHLQPAAPTLPGRIWQATLSPSGARRAGRAGDGLMLSRTQVRETGQTLDDVQLPIIDEYLRALPEGVEPRILASRTLVVVDEENRAAALRHAEERVRSLARGFLRSPEASAGDLDELFALTNTCFGTVPEVVDRLGADATAARADEVSFQVHSIDPGHELALRSLELIATEVAPQLGWGGAGA
ncbi:putative FMN-dependent luciferase-like monooxygenase [Gulosibacter sp. 10]|uniref:putative FMN-dependent luciferase-like monooxygenase n=1 Tax=Gulosibacter sp. 10 TaxID=1255570 RepID=UPI00097ED98C|nr:putative FMN-dependent luciferase-like monooxygenase [Gulosibacter sp. 10]SJM62594.1 Alkanal monooxygenase alpha chain [Gulosibacter sp. 10]